MRRSTKRMLPWFPLESPAPSARSASLLLDTLAARARPLRRSAGIRHMPAHRRLNKRQRRRAREAQHDLRAQYRERDLPFQNGVATAIFEDAYAPAA
jgi:hypothetical protein